MFQNHSRFQAFWFSSLGLGSLFLLFTAGSLLGSLLFSQIRFDMTDQKEHTFSQDSLELLQTLNAPLDLYFYYSREGLRQGPLERYGEEIYYTLKRLVEIQPQLKLHVLDLVPYSDDEADALLRGIHSVGENNGKALYLGLAIIGPDEQRQTIASFDPKRSPSLLYDLITALYQASPHPRPNIGFYSTLPLGDRYNPYSGLDHFKPQKVYLTLQKLYQPFSLPPGKPLDEELLNKLDLLILIQPDDRFSQKDAAALERFLRRGGRAMVLLDSKSEYFVKETYSEPLLELLASYGVAFLPKSVVIEPQGAQRVTQNKKSGRHYGVFNTPNLNPDHPITSGLEKLRFASSSAFVLKQKEGISITPLVLTSNSAATLGVSSFDRLFLPANDPSAKPPVFVNPRFLPLAVYVQGVAEPYWDHGSPKVINLAAVADTSWLSDSYWLDANQNASTDNGAFFLNLVDYLSGNPKLLSIRHASKVIRPLDRLSKQLEGEDLHLRAETSSLKQEKIDLEKALTALELKRDLNQTRPPKQQKISEMLQSQINNLGVLIRRQKEKLYRHFEGLYNFIRALNILLMPLLITLSGFVWFAFLHLRRTKQASKSK